MHDYKHPKKVNIIVEHCPPGIHDGNPCHCLKAGEVFEFDFERCPQNFCAAAFHSLWPTLRVLEMGGRHPWDHEEGVSYSNCPDPDRAVLFRLETVSEED